MGVKCTNHYQIEYKAEGLMITAGVLLKSLGSTTD